MGCWTASLRASRVWDGIVYCTALPTGLGLMAAYEWSADESRVTVVVLGLIAMLLGALRPRQAMLSGALVGLVVAGVIGFEALSGIRPPYEERAQTLTHGLRWMILLVPALSPAAVGARIGRWMLSALPSPRDRGPSRPPARICRARRLPRRSCSGSSRSARPRWARPAGMRSR